MNFNSELAYSKEGNLIEGLFIISPKVFSDERGFFLESWNQRYWENLLYENKQVSKYFVQDNHSKSSKGVLRGLHFQKDPNSQGKLVRCISGEIYDVAVDIRKKSKSFCNWFGIKLSAKNMKQLWIPRGFAHGFLTLSEEAQVIYKTTDFWNKESERSIIWNDKAININWPLQLIDHKIELSKKDENAPKINEFQAEDLF